MQTSSSIPITILLPKQIHNFIGEKHLIKFKHVTIMALGTCKNIKSFKI